MHSMLCVVVLLLLSPASGFLPGRQCSVVNGKKCKASNAGAQRLQQSSSNGGGDDLMDSLKKGSKTGAAYNTAAATTTEVGQKLGWDASSGRFFEKSVEEACEEEFCLLDEETGTPILLTREEKERVFLDSIQQYYFSGKSTLPDDQFDRLREDLSWEGSILVSLNRQETLFMNAAIAYRKGKPIISDPEYDELKRALKESNSKIAVQSDPKCYVDTGVCKVTWRPDQVRTSSLYVPATLILTIGVLGVFYELLNAVGFAVNPLVLLAVGAVPIRAGAQVLTEDFFFKDPFVAAGPCPSCGVENRIFFGDVLGISGDSEEASTKCTNCKAGMTVRRSTLRVSTLLGAKKGPPPAAASSEDE